jgi:type II secretory pathway pseudopilin PulG
VFLQKNQDGLTTVELIIIIILLGILAAVSIPAYHSLHKNAQETVTLSNEQAIESAQLMKFYKLLLSGAAINPANIKVEGSDFFSGTIPKQTYSGASAGYGNGGSFYTSSAPNSNLAHLISSNDPSANGSNFPSSTNSAIIPGISNLGPISIPVLDQHSAVLMFQARRNGQLSIQKSLSKDLGGVLEIGNKNTGYHEIYVDKNSLFDDISLTMSWAVPSADEPASLTFDFGPHGTQFQSPIRISLSYTVLNLKNIPEERLRIFYWNEETGIWEFMGGTVDQNDKSIEFYTDHFSRYSVAFSR